MTGVHKDATAHLYINGNPVDSAPGNILGLVHFDNIPMLEEGMVLTARQELNGNQSAMSEERSVHALYEDLSKPVIPYDVWECGQAVTAQAQVPGTLMRLYVDDWLVEEEFTTDRWRNDKWPLEFLSGLDLGREISVDMVYCPDTEDEQVSPRSEVSFPKESPSTVELDSVTAYADTNRLRLDGTYVGSIDSFFKNGDPLFDNLSFFGDHYHMNFSNWTVGENDVFNVQPELCPGTAGHGTIADVTSTQETLALLNLVTIEDPICPETDVIRVKTPLATGHVVVFVNGVWQQVQPVSGNPTIIDVSNLNLDQGDIVGVRQYLPYDGGMHESEMATVQIDEDSNHNLTVTLRLLQFLGHIEENDSEISTRCSNDQALSKRV